MNDQPKPEVGDIVFYFNDELWPMAAQIAYCHEDQLDYSDLPIVNLSIIRPDGKQVYATGIFPAYHDGARWRKKHRWCPKTGPMRLPDEEFCYDNPLPHVAVKRSIHSEGVATH